MRKGRENMKPQTLDEKQIARVRAAILSGAKVQDVAKRFCVSKMYLIRLGLTRKKVNAG
jgi:transposase